VSPIEQRLRIGVCIVGAWVVFMTNDSWEDLYVRAAQEVDGKRVPERVAAAKDAVRIRLKELGGSSNHYKERVRLASTLVRLDSLETDAQKW
jgi:hypothetical protein